jgi:hypothetical protein
MFAEKSSRALANVVKNDMRIGQIGVVCDHFAMRRMGGSDFYKLRKRFDDLTANQRKENMASSARTRGVVPKMATRWVMCA